MFGAFDDEQFNKMWHTLPELIPFVGQSISFCKKKGSRVKKDIPMSL